MVIDNNDNSNLKLKSNYIILYRLSFLFNWKKEMTTIQNVTFVVQFKVKHRSIKASNVVVKV